MVVNWIILNSCSLLARMGEKMTGIYYGVLGNPISLKAVQDTLATRHNAFTVPTADKMVGLVWQPDSRLARNVGGPAATRDRCESFLCCVSSHNDR